MPFSSRSPHTRTTFTIDLRAEGPHVTGSIGVTGYDLTPADLVPVVCELLRGHPDLESLRAPADALADSTDALADALRHATTPPPERETHHG